VLGGLLAGGLVAGHPGGGKAQHVEGADEVDPHDRGHTPATSMARGRRTTRARTSGAAARIGTRHTQITRDAIAIGERGAARGVVAELVEQLRAAGFVDVRARRIMPGEALYAFFASSP